MILYPNCKINLGLRIIRKREDGYHDLETVFLPIYALHDELEVIQSEHFSFVQEGIAIDCAADNNLIIRCYNQMRAKYSQIQDVSIRLRKNIPFGAGLGGGSSDAAHMAILLNDLFQLGLSKAQLAEEIRPLGADCPFFIYNKPCYASGIGDKLKPIPLSLHGTRIVLVKPNEGVSTLEAYRGISLHPEIEGELMHIMSRESSLKEILAHKGATIINDFEDTVFPHHSSICQIKEHLQNAGALYASMSGSGSAIYGLFEDDPEGRTMARLRIFEQKFSSMILLNDSLG